ncbi:hypothetical protein HY969_00650 [Candidatus Kaiserbacteria bacterium]|nr:hypothetical protein [Candidatus Kaiserbacteria bacterium]
MFKYSAIALVVLLFVILGGWYIYLKKETSTIERVDEGRGAGVEEPSPASTLGSTFSNIVSGFRNTETPVNTPTGMEIDQSGGFKSFIARLTGSRTNGISSFSGTVKNAFGELVSDILPERTPPERPKPPRLWHAHGTAIAGAAFVASTTNLRFMERATGHLFDVDVETGEVKRISNTLVPKAYGASFAPDGSVIAWTDVNGSPEVFSGTLATSSSTSSPSSLQTTDLGPGITAIVPNVSTKQFLSIVEDGNSFALMSSGWKGEDPVRVAATALRDWHIFWGERIVLSQAPATGIDGYAYEVSLNGIFTPLVRAVPGLTVLPHPRESALLISSDNGSLNLSVSTSSAMRVGLSVRTIADKCVWVPDKSLIAYCAVPESLSSSRFLDEWYAGALHTEDAWWKVDAKAGSAELLFSPHSDMGVSLDVTAPAIDDGGAYLSFINARDQSLWILRIQN